MLARRSQVMLTGFLACSLLLATALFRSNSAPLSAKAASPESKAPFSLAGLSVNQAPGLQGEIPRPPPPPTDWETDWLFEMPPPPFFGEEGLRPPPFPLSVLD
ncbi:hypothetical protein [Coraliomargarita parva]|uniref:hypothetical protein n=1 Tax=Coraliomargarita parva TaxID=3014050 RepID=UPI0022B302CB|nr:hypothetical protein [Coraliomargarita parva]